MKVAMLAPMPGSTPTMVPRVPPMKTHMILVSEVAVWKPTARSEKIASMLIIIVAKSMKRVVATVSPTESITMP